MPGLQTEGFRAQLPLVPTIPENIGKVDVKSIYDRVVQGLQTGDAIRTEGARQRVDDEQLKLAAQQAQAGQATLPSATAAEIGKSNVLAAQNSLAVAVKSGQLASDRLDTLLADTSFQNSLSPQQRNILAQHGAPTTSTVNQARGPNGELVQTATETAQLPGAPAQPISTSTATGPAPFALAPAGPGGISLGTLVSNGKGGQEVVHAPPAMLNNIVGTEPVFLGTEPNSQGVLVDKYLIREFNAMGGTRDGAKFDQASGLPAPNSTGVREFKQPTSSAPSQANGATLDRTQILSDAAKQAVGGHVNAEVQAKARQEALTNLGDERLASDSALGNLAQLDKVIAEYNKDGVVPNAVRGHATVLPEVQKFNGAISQFVSDIVGKLKGTGRVALPEFQFSQAAYPFATDAEEVQIAKANYLKSVAQVASKRIDLMKTLVSGGSTLPDAQFAASKAFPLPAPISTGAPSTAAPEAQRTQTTAAPQGSYKIVATTPDAIRAEALKAKQAGYKSVTTPDGVEHVLAPDAQ